MLPIYLIFEGVRERVVGEVCPLHDLPDPLARRDVLGGTVELAVIYRAQDHGLELEQKLSGNVASWKSARIEIRLHRLSSPCGRSFVCFVSG